MKPSQTMGQLIFQMVLHLVIRQALQITVNLHLRVPIQHLVSVPVVPSK